MPAKKTETSETDNVTPDENTDATVLQENNPVQETTNDKSLAELANDVLHGRFGNFNDVRENLDKAGADTTAVLTLVNERLSRGAPSSYRPNVSQVLDSAQRGEWGENNIALRVRAAGFSEADALHVESSLNKKD